jgi:hypothetical protein
VKALLRRELRRLAPLTAGLLLLSCVLLAVELNGVRFFNMTLSVGTMLLVPALLGVATVAPDTGAGGTAFLSRLPLRPAQVIVGKALCGWLLALVAVAPFLVASAIYDGVDLILGLLPAWGFAAGLLASVVAHRVMAALLVAPVLLVVVMLVAGLLPAVALEINGPLPGLAVFSVALVAAAVAAFVRGERHRISARPALVAAAILGPLVPLNFAATAGAQAWTYAEVLPGALRVKRAAPAGARVAVAMEADLWTGRERRVAVLDGDRAWLVPARGAVLPDVSPDGRFLLLRAMFDPGGWIVDLEAGTTTAVTGRASVGFGYTDAVWSDTGLVQLVRGRSSVETFTPHPVDDLQLGPDSACATRPMPGASYAGVTPDGRALLTDVEGVISVPLPQPGQTAHEAPTRVFSWPWLGAPGGAVVSPSGRRLLALVPASKGLSERLLLADLATGGRAELDSAPDGHPYRARLDRGNVRFSADERRVALTLSGEHVASFDLATGALLGHHDAPADDDVRAWLGAAPFWSSDGGALALPWGTVVFYGPHALAGGRCEQATAHSHAEAPARAVALLGDGQALVEGQPLALTRLFVRPGASEAPALVVLSQGGAR